MLRLILKGFHLSGYVIDSLNFRLEKGIEESEEIGKVFKYSYSRTEIRNQSRQVFQKLIDECN